MARAAVARLGYTGDVATKPSTPLATYAKKRDFAKTPEPSGERTTTAPASDGRLRFVVQMHRATRLHYDFRLEADGVLKSWAIPKGPSFDTHEKRLAMAVEDHPLDYRDFEGVIPAGNYGAGEVIVWDHGTYRLTEGTDLAAQIAAGSVKIEMFGEKLHGKFALVHIKGRGGEANAWLLVKERDDFVDPSWHVEDHARSVKTGRTLVDIARDPAAKKWTSRSAATSRAEPAHREALPDTVSPMLATAIDAAFDDPAWSFELKWDGYRALVRIDDDGSVTVTSRNGNDFTKKFTELAALADAFAERPVIVDGEIVVLDARGRASFSALQERVDRFGRSSPDRAPVTFAVFDVIYGNGRDLRGEPLERRKAILEAMLTGRGPVMLSKHVVENGTALYELAKTSGLEGIVGKRLSAPYVERRSRDWVKIKAQRRVEVVIGGWTEGRGSRKHFGALLAGVYDDGKLAYAGSVGSGFDGKKLAALAAQLAPLERKTSPFATAPKTQAKAHWVEPTLVAEVTFTEWTRDGSLRHPVFVALRVDKDPQDVAREVVASASEAARAPAGETARPKRATQPTTSPGGTRARRTRANARPAAPSDGGD
ncbi:MAG: hypothetical protein NVS1B2_02030 [Vulcanimicrobiaceae bacterium]